ncbi:MAG: hypothetical protein JWQ37_102 [Blastococcus sp.]|nr:hypothetical protein [Blastococcus sp.]
MLVECGAPAAVIFVRSGTVQRPDGGLHQAGHWTELP